MDIKFEEIKGTNLWNQFEATVGTARTVSQKNDLMEILRSFQNKCIMENRNGKRLEGTSFLGEDSSGPNISKRHKQTYEKW